MLTYATVDDLAAFDDGAIDPSCVDNVNGLLRTASLRVAEATAGDFYTVDDTGLPTDATTLQAFKDATLIHVSALINLGVSGSTGGVTTARTLTAVSIGSASKTYGDAAQAASDRAAAAVSLVPDALSVLQLAGLARGLVIGVG